MTAQNKTVLGIVVLIIFVTFVGISLWMTLPSYLERRDIIDEFMPTPTSQLPSKPSLNTIRDETKITARFQIYTNGLLRTFSSPMYLNQSPEVFIPAAEPDTVVATQPGTTWADFFATLPFELTTDCLTTGTGETYCSGAGGDLQFYLNGEKQADALETEIGQGDELIVRFDSK